MYGYDSTNITSYAPRDGKFFVENCDFSYFKNDYSQYPSLASCRNNIIFKAHPQAVDLVPSTHIFNSKIT